MIIKLFIAQRNAVLGTNQRANQPGFSTRWAPIPKVVF
jgi:hypothetical protein